MSNASQPKALPSIAELLPLFQQLLPASVIEAQVKASGRRFYERLWTPLVLVWCLVFQRLHQDHSADAVVSYASSGALDALDTRHATPLAQRMLSQSTSAYVQGRSRLPLSLLTGGLRHTAGVTNTWLGEPGRWLGHRVVLLDGSTILLRPEDELIKHYGRHHNQQGALYWVVMRVVVAFCLYSGTLLAATEGPLANSEQALAWAVLASVEPGAVVVGDGNFGVYSVAQAAYCGGVQVLVRLSRTRAQHLAGGGLQSGADRPVTWRPSAQDHPQPGVPHYAIAGRVLCVRLEQPGFRTLTLYLFTTLTDPQRYPVAELVQLYGRRWHVELNLRYVKATLDLGLLNAKSVDTVRKEYYAGLLGYNLIRAFMVQAAQAADLTPLALSFASCWRRVVDFLRQIGGLVTLADYAHPFVQLLQRLAKRRLPVRPSGRLEPRMVRRRPMRYKNLKGSREAARQLVRQQLAEPKSKS